MTKGGIMKKQQLSYLLFYLICLPSLLIATNFLETNVAKAQETTTQKKAIEKDWTILVYMAADNDLRGFAARNIKQMAVVGSNKHLNLCAHLDIRLRANQKVTRHYIIQKNKVIHANANDPLTQRMDSGSPQTLIAACKWAFKSFPAKNYGLIFWNHGTGIIDPMSGRIINISDLFLFDPIINKFELDRSIGFFDFMGEQRGLCWDDSTGHYLTNQKLETALKTVKETILGNKKLALIGFDACLMSMLEIANIVKDYAQVMVSSQEVELGTGWDYSHILSPFLRKSMSNFSFAQHIVTMYQQLYNRITNDYTLSALNLDLINPIENNVEQVATMLLNAIPQQSNKSVTKVLKAARNKRACTHFDEPSYIDLHHFYQNLLRNSNRIQLRNAAQSKKFVSNLTGLLQEGSQLISDAVFANVVGKNLRFAKGISIYFPENRLHPSYGKSKFARNSAWQKLLVYYARN